MKLARPHSRSTNERGINLLEVSIAMVVLGATLMFFTASMGQDLVFYQQSRVEDSKITFVEAVAERLITQMENYLEMAGTTEPACDLREHPFAMAWKNADGGPIDFGGGVRGKLVQSEADLPALTPDFVGSSQAVARERCLYSQTLNQPDSDFSKATGFYFCLKLEDLSGEESGSLEGVQNVFLEASYHRTYIHDPSQALGVSNPNGAPLDCETQSGIIPFPTIKALYVTLYWTVSTSRGSRFMEYTTLIWSGGSSM